jgi:hypothetical protein
LGIFPPRVVNFVGFLRNDTISSTSSFASSNPATSANVIFILSSASYNEAHDLPILKI